MARVPGPCLWQPTVFSHTVPGASPGTSFGFILSSPRGYVVLRSVGRILHLTPESPSPWELLFPGESFPFTRMVIGNIWFREVAQFQTASFSSFFMNRGFLAL